ncbi:unnamed protein product [Meloidogyne enterolobii]|uniref:Uncharacterized protein n=1 Tax=Meloidogyne enterolobii TaxID=390850 RepID=A0ACB0YN67_MELEN
MFVILLTKSVLPLSIQVRMLVEHLLMLVWLVNLRKMFVMLSKTHTKLFLVEYKVVFLMLGRPLKAGLDVDG